MCRRWLCASYIPTYGSGLRPVCASKVPVKCPLSKVSIMVKDPGAVNKNNARRKKRRLLQLGRRKKLAKKSVRARPMPGGYQSWPVLRPYDLMQHMLAAGLESELLPAKNFEVSFIYCGVFVRVYTYISIYDYIYILYAVETYSLSPSPPFPSASPSPMHSLSLSISHLHSHAVSLPLSHSHSPSHS